MLKDAPAHAYIPVTNLKRAREFYEDKVGLDPGKPFASGAIYECGKGSIVFMYESVGAGTSKASILFWQVDDVEAEVAALKTRGVVFERYDMPHLTWHGEIATSGGARTAWFKDSEGNILAISQDVSEE